jgi:phi13 family phage major tail protein
MAAKNPSKVKFGLKNVYYATYTEGDGDVTYATPVRIPGAVNLTLDREGESSDFYADDIDYFHLEGSSRYSGTLEVALLPDSFQTAVLGVVLDKNGMLVEFADAVQKPFALLFEVATDTDPYKFVFYNVTAANPAVNAQTRGETTEVQTITVDITAVPIELPYGTGVKRPVTKGQLSLSADNQAAYDGFYTAVLKPTPVAA